MSRLWQQFAALITAGDVRISEHGYDALADDGLTVDELLAGVGSAVIVEEYPEYPKGAAVLVLPADSRRQPGSCCVGYASWIQYACCAGNGLQA